MQVAKHDDLSGFGPAATYHVIAESSQPFAIFAVLGYPALDLFTVFPAGVNVYNHPLGSDLPPAKALVAAFPELQFDSFVTIGALTSDEGDVQLAPGTSAQLSGLTGSFTLTEGAWFTPAAVPAEQCGESNWRLVVAQFTVSPVGLFEGKWNLQANGGLWGPIWWPIPLSCAPDLTGDRAVGVADLLVLLGQWGPCGCLCNADLNGDGEVGVADLLELLAAWGEC